MWRHFVVSLLQTFLIMMVPRVTCFQQGIVLKTKICCNRFKGHASRKHTLYNARTDLILFDRSKSTSDDFSYDVKSFDRDGQWMKIDYSNIPIDKNSENSGSTIVKSNKLQSVFAPIHSSPVEAKLINDKLVYIKRDDLLHLRDSNVSGNKARKMLSLNELNAKEFPEVVVSYGGPQSNAMVALAAIVQSKNAQVNLDEKSDESAIIDEIESDGWIMKDEKISEEIGEEKDELSDTSDVMPNQSNPNIRMKRFVYYTKKLPRYLRNQPNGNLLRALTLGMELVQLKPDVYKKLFGGENGGSAVAPIEAPVEGASLWVSIRIVSILSSTFRKLLVLLYETL